MTADTNQPGIDSEAGQLLTAEEVAQMLKVKKSWVFTAAREGNLPVVKLGRYRRFRREAVEDWLNQLEASS
jgi:excisionase family DNA binding protein